LSSLSEWFATGGSTMWIISGLDMCAGFVVFIAVILAFVARFTGKGGTAARVFVTLGLLTAIIPTCAGLGGQWWAERAVDAAIAGASADSMQTLLESGYASAEVPRNAGCGSTCFLLFPALLAMLVAPNKKRGWVEALDETQA
jgi:hypothetical protein